MLTVNKLREFGANVEEGLQSQNGMSCLPCHSDQDEHTMTRKIILGQI